MSERGQEGEQHEQPLSPTGVSQRQEAAMLLEHVAARGVRVLSSQGDVLVRLRDRLDTSDI